MVIVRQKENNLLKYNVAGDCLAIKPEGDLKSWTKYRVSQKNVNNFNDV